MKPLRVALYCRVSTQEQSRNGESIEDQRQALRAWVTENMHATAGEYIDAGFSARKRYSGRPEMMRLLNDVRAGAVDLIVFTKLDRWFRNLRDYYEVQSILDAAGVNWRSILEDYETETSAGRFKLNIMLSVAQHEADATSERIKFTFAQKRQRGEICGGKMPQGYILENKRPVIDAEKHAAVAAFWNSYLKSGSMSKAIEAAGNHGLWIPISTGSVMLRNADRYAGEIQGIQCDAYISKEDAARVLASRKHRTPRKSDRVYLFSGIVFCGTCHGRMGGRYCHKTDITYNCTDHNMRRRKDCCPCKINILERDIENGILQQMETALDAFAVAAEIEAAKPAAPDAEKQRAKLQRKRDRLLDIYIDGSISKETYKTRCDAIDAALAELNATPAPTITPEEIRAILPNNWREIYAGLDRERKRAFYFQLLRRVEVMPDRSISIVEFAL